MGHVYYGTIVTDHRDVPVEILESHEYQGQCIYRCRILRKIDACPPLFVGSEIYVSPGSFITEDRERIRKVWTLPEQHEIHAELCLYYEVRERIQVERVIIRVRDTCFQGFFEEDEWPYMKAVIDCALNIGLDIYPQYGHSLAYKRYCFMCTGDICIRFHGFMWRSLIGEVARMREEERRERKKFRFWPF